MNKKNVMKNKPTKTEFISIRITPKLSKWMKDKKYSPTGIFEEATRQLGYKGDQDGKAGLLEK
jgi:hypothetical protein